MRICLWTPAITLALLACSFAAMAQQAEGDPMVGRMVAQRWCAGCHLVGPVPPSAVANDAAPAFVSIANRPSTDAARLHTFLEKPHPPMPDFSLSRADKDNLVAAILSLRTP